MVTNVCEVYITLRRQRFQTFEASIDRLAQVNFNFRKIKVKETSFSELSQTTYKGNASSIVEYIRQKNRKRFSRKTGARL